MSEASITLGTCTIQIKGEGGTDAGNAFLTISKPDGKATTCLSLTVWMLQHPKDDDAALVSWQGSVPLKEWKFLNIDGESSQHDADEQSPLERGVQFLLSPPAKMETQWTSTTTDGASLALAIRDSRKGITLTPWKGALQQQTSGSGSSSIQASLLEALQSVHAERAALEQTVAVQREQHEQQQAKLRHAAQAYQLTATALEGAWDAEKKELLANFVKLYQARNNLLQSQTAEIERLQKELDDAVYAAATSSPAVSRRTKTKAKTSNDDDILQDVPEDQLNVDETMASYLERGEPVPYGRPVPTKAKKTAAKSKKAKPPPMRQTNVTGATEYMDADVAMDDVLGNTEPKNPSASRKKTPTISKSHQKPPPDKISTKAEPPETSDSKRPAKKARVRAVADSSSDSDNQAPTSRRRRTGSSVAASQQSITKDSASAPVKQESQTLEDDSKPAKTKAAARRRAATDSSDTDSSGPIVRRRRTGGTSTVPIKVESPTPVTNPTAKPTRHRAAADSSDSDSSGPVVRRKRRGVVASQQSPTAASARQKVRSGSSDDSGNGNNVLRRGDTTSSRRREASQQEQTKDNDAKKNDDSSTDEEEDYMRQDIMSQLALLRQQEEGEEEND